MIVEIVWVMVYGVGENGNCGLKIVSNERVYIFLVVYLYV